MAEKRNRRDDQVRVRQYISTRSSAIGELLDFIQDNRPAALTLLALLVPIFVSFFLFGVMRETAKVEDMEVKVTRLNGQLATEAEMNKELNQQLSNLKQKLTIAQTELAGCRATGKPGKTKPSASSARKEKSHQ